MTISLHAPDPVLHAPAMLERERELAAIHDALLRAEAGAGSTLVIEGEAGIGKSTLVRHAVAAARARGIRVLRAQGGELERALPHGVVLDLFGGVIRDPARADSLFAGPARNAAPLFGVRAAVPEAGDDRAIDRIDPVAHVHALFWLVLNLVEDGPIAIVVDDAQWADEPSLRFLLHLVRRAGELPVVVLLAMRPDAGDPSSTAALLRGEGAAIHLAPEPLSEHAVGALVADAGGRPVPRELRHAAWQATGGNPFLVTELATELARTAAADPAALVGARPEGVGRYVDARLAAGGPAARALAEAVAVLGESSTLHRAASVAGLDAVAAADAARWLVRAAILADAEPLAFRHPILRGAVDAATPGPARAELHRRAGLHLAAEGAEIGVVGAQLHEGAASGDPEVVRLLRLAADDATTRGAPKTAATLLRRAMAEPPTADRRVEVLSALARAEAAASLPTAPETFAEALAIARDPAERAQLRLDLGGALLAGGQWPAACEAFTAGLQEAPDDAPAIRARLEAGYLSSAWVTMGDTGDVGQRVRRILEAETLGEANRELAAWIAFQQGAVVASPAHEMRRLVQRIFAEAPVEDLVWEGQTVEISAGVLIATGDLELEVEILTRALAAARRDGPIGKAGIYAYCRSWPSYHLGRLTDAIADCEEALRAAELGWEAFVPAASTVAALAHIERDDLDAAERAIALDPERWGGRIDTAMLIPMAAGRLALARGEIDTAADILRRAGEGAGAAFMRNGIPTDWRTWLATALLRLDRRDEARQVAAEGLEIARAWGAEWPLGASLRVAGLVEGGPAGIDLLREGEELLKDSPGHLEHARLLVTLGATLRRNGGLTEARTVLTRAADLAQRIGARALLRRATDELRAAGARRRRVALTGIDALTPAELRVAREALAGRTNRDIAQALFVTPKAVEFHLANTYRKLGISGRSDLPLAMGERSAA